VLVVAPFERGRAHGGSQRATAMAERLEERGAEVEWVTRGVTRGSPGQKAAALLLRREPEVVRENTRPRLVVDGRWDAAIAAHSYMAPHLDALPAGVRRVVDFHNVEWRVLDALGRGIGGARGAYKRVQARLMERFERAVLASGAAAAMASEDELAWAREAGARGTALLVPNVLPRGDVAEARRIGEARGGGEALRGRGALHGREALPAAGASAEARGGAAGAPLVYVGTLTFPPNVAALLGWLERDWPAVRAAVPGVELAVAGRCGPGVGEAISAHPGVRALGFVEDLAELLVAAPAAVLPFGGEGGSSLRFLHFALARVPVISTPEATRGLPFAPGLVAATPGEWAAAVAACVARDGSVAGAVEDAERAVTALQDDEAPWDRLWEVVAG
jgi:hypothetical protein